MQAHTNSLPQTLGGQFEVDGRFKGDLSVKTISCDTTANTCVVPVPAPGFALVFMDTSEPAVTFGTATQTFATTAHTKAHNTATADPSVLATSNGHSAQNRAGELGSTSPGSVSSGAHRAAVASGLAGIVAACAGALWVGAALVR